MSESHFVARSKMPASADSVFDWHSRPGAFERLTPPWADVRIEDSRGGVATGDWKRLRVGAGPLGFSWKLEHEELKGAGFVDIQQKGPFRSWRHEHHFIPTAEAESVLEDRISYQLPLGHVGSVLAERFVQSKLDDLFRFRHRRTRDDLTRHAEAGFAGPLRIAITGSSGFVGRQLVAFLRTGGHEVVSLVRRRPVGVGEIYWEPSRGEIDAEVLEDFDAVIHLAGESIADGRWTPTRQAAILNSRVHGTALLARTLASLNRPPSVFVSASAIGFYGDARDAELSEESPQGEGFLAGVCREWEDAALPAAEAGIRVVHPRIGVVIAGDGGLLGRVGPLFRLALGGPLGNGGQTMSWIARDDLLAIILQAIADPRLSGPINAVAPNPVTNKTFAQTLGQVLRRPAVIRTPPVVLRLGAGKMADELFLSSQLVRPARLEEIGFRFAFPTLEDTLRHELGALQRSPQIELTSTSASPVMRTQPAKEGL